MQVYDALLVLGCGIDPKGELIDDSRESVEIAARLFHEGIAPLVIFSGNYSYKATFVPPRGEAEAMQAYAAEQGIPKDATIVETQSKDTLGNVFFTKTTILEPQGLRRIAVLSGPNHSHEKLKFICRKVWGPEYTYTTLERDFRHGEEDRERASLAALHELLDHVTDGDDAALYHVLKTKHPGHRET